LTGSVVEKSALVIWATEAVGSADRINPTMPATAGAAAEVPPIPPYPPLITVVA
jgi:hypothetical protein